MGNGFICTGDGGDQRAAGRSQLANDNSIDRVPLGDIVEPSAHDVPTTARSQRDEAQPGRPGTRLDARNSIESAPSSLTGWAHSA